MAFLAWVERLRTHVRPKIEFTKYMAHDWILHTNISKMQPTQMLFDDKERCLQLAAYWWPDGPDLKLEETPSGYATAIKVLMGSGKVKVLIDDKPREFHLHQEFQPIVVVPEHTVWMMDGGKHHDMLVTLQLTYKSEILAML